MWLGLGLGVGLGLSTPVHDGSPVPIITDGVYLHQGRCAQEHMRSGAELTNALSAVEGLLALISIDNLDEQ